MTYSHKRRESTRMDRRDDQDASTIAAQEKSIVRGYSDGYITAKIFAAYGLSKLGFTGQYIADSIAALGPKIGRAHV